jgi:hypothetical protein
VQYRRKQYNPHAELTHELERLHADPDATEQQIEEAEKTLVEGMKAYEQYKPEAQRPELGFIAEEVDEVLPNMVVPETDRTPMVLKYDRFTSLLAKAIQELDARIAAIEERL